MREPITVHIGGPDDPWLNEDRGVFPSTTSYRAERYYAKHGKPMPLVTMGHHVINFIEQNLVLTNAHFAGKPFLLMAWQKRLLLEAYEVKPETRALYIDEHAWVRVHRWAILGVPKKNGKSELIGGLGLYHFTDDDETAPEVICAASAEDQADKVFEPAKFMARNSGLADFLKVDSGLISMADGSKGSFKRVAATSGTNDGGNESAVLLDELHEWVKPKARDVYTVLTGGGVMRRQPIIWAITTAGVDFDSICHETYEHGLAVRDGDIEDPTLYFCWFEADEDAKHTDPETWRVANPSFGKMMQADFYVDMLTKRDESRFRRYYCNNWAEAEEIWEAAELWPHLAGLPELFADRKTWVGIDIGRKHDNSVVVVVQWDPDTRKFQIEQKIWSNPYRRRTKAYSEWRMDIALVEAYCRELYERFPERTMEDEEEYLRPGPAFFYDPHLFARSAEILEGDGMHMVEFPQTDTRMVPASQRLFEIIKTEEILHDGDAQATRHMKAVVAKERERGWRISKVQGGGRPNDFAIALAMPLYIASDMVAEGEQPAFTIW